MPLICPTCQVLAQSLLTGDRHATLHGVVFDILFGSQSDAGVAARILLEATRQRGLLQRNWRTRHDSNV